MIYILEVEDCRFEYIKRNMLSYCEQILDKKKMHDKYVSDKDMACMWMYLNVSPVEYEQVEPLIALIERSNSMNEFHRNLNDLCAQDYLGHVDGNFWIFRKHKYLRSVEEFIGEVIDRATTFLVSCGCRRYITTVSI